STCQNGTVCGSPAPSPTAATAALRGDVSVLWPSTGWSVTARVWSAEAAATSPGPDDGTGRSSALPRRDAFVLRRGSSHSPRTIPRGAGPPIVNAYGDSRHAGRGGCSGPSNDRAARARPVHLRRSLRPVAPGQPVNGPP